MTFEVSSQLCQSLTSQPVQMLRDPIFHFQLRYEFRSEPFAWELYFTKFLVENALNKRTTVLVLAMEGCNFRKHSICHTNFRDECSVSLDNSAAIIRFDSEPPRLEAQSYCQHRAVFRSRIECAASC